MIAAACPQGARGSPAKTNAMLLHSLSYSFHLLSAPLFRTAAGTSFTHEYTQHFLSCHHDCRSTNSRAYGKFTCELSGAANSCYSLTSRPGIILDNTGCPLDRGEQGLHFVPHCRNCLNEQEHCIYQVNRCDQSKGSQDNQKTVEEIKQHTEDSN